MRLTHMTIIDNAPDAVKKTYFRMKKEKGNKIELKTIMGNYYLYAARGVWDKNKKKPVKKTVLMRKIDENGMYREKGREDRCISK